MNQEQVAIFLILAGILALFAWGRIRYDVVAFMGLILCVLLGLVPVQDAFSANFGAKICTKYENVSRP